MPYSTHIQDQKSVDSGECRDGLTLADNGADEDSDKRMSAPVRVGLRGYHKLIESPAPAT